jgi:hypothetical protein
MQSQQQGQEQQQEQEQDSPHTKGQLEEDELCSTHLQTAIIFKTLRQRFRELQSSSSIANTHKEHLAESIQYVKEGMAGIQSMGTAYFVEMPVDSSGLAQRIEDSVCKDLQKAIDQRILELDYEMVYITHKMNSIRSLLKVAVEDMVGPDSLSKKLCPVCFDREIGVALIPCGHTYCVGCAEYDKYTKCPQCRSVVTSRIKLYFSM